MIRPHRLYVGTIGEGLFLSTDHGASFQRSCDGMFVECHVRALVVHPRHPRVLFMGTEQGLFVSRDGAGNWQRVSSPLDGKQIWSLLIAPDPKLMLAGTCPAELFRSDDEGRTWREAKASPVRECPRIIHSRVTTLAAHPTEAATLFAGVEIGGLLRSRDAGLSWEPIGTGLSSLDIHDLVIQPGQMLASTNNDVNRSTDGAATWEKLGLPAKLPLPYFRALTALPGKPDWLLLGNGDRPPGWTGTIARSTDAGRTWQQASFPGRANSTIWKFAVCPADDQLVYAASVSGQLYRSTDAGESWEKLPVEFGEIRALAWTE
ncbi:MAG: WD40/YVTN/BNR-like repeat-containing protein [Gemmataceae bacterium]